MEQRVSLITLGVSDVARSRQFYQRLGWKASSIGGDEAAFFQIGGLVLGLYGAAALAEDTGLPESDSRPGKVALAYNVRDKADVNTTLAEAEGAGARVTKGPEEKFWGGYSGYFADPDGHPWEVAWNPGFELKEDGTILLPA